MSTLHLHPTLHKSHLVTEMLHCGSDVSSVLTWKLPTIMSPAAQIQPVERPAVLRTQFWCFSMTWAYRSSPIKITEGGRRNKTNIFIFTYLSSRQNHSSGDGSLSNLPEHGINKKHHSTCPSCRVGSSPLLDIELQDGKADRMCITLCQEVPSLPSC